MPRQVHVRGLSLTVLEGPRNGPPLVLLAGLMDLWTDYVAVLPQLAQRFHVIMVEHRGHGTSQWADDGKYRVIDYADDLIAVLDTLAPGPVSISGNSLSGLIALDVAIRRPDLVRAISLEDPPLFISEAPRFASHWLTPMFTSMIDALMQWRDASESLDSLPARLASLPMHRPRMEMEFAGRKVAHDRMVAQFCTGDALDEQEQARLANGWRRYLHGDRPTLGECFPQAAFRPMAEVLGTVDPRAPLHATELRLNEGFDHLTALRAVRCPVLTLEADRVMAGIVPPADIEVMKQALQRTTHRHVLIEGAGHHIHCDAPGAFVTETADFLLSLPQVSG